MAVPPKTPPHSDIDGVNRDARIQMPQQDDKPDPGEQINNAADGSAARPDETEPL